MEAILVPADKTHGEFVAEELNRDPSFREEWEQSAPARALSINLIRYRAEHKLSQRALAEKLGMQQPAVARLEAGEHTPELRTLERISQRLGMEFAIDIVPAEREPRLMTKRVQDKAASHVRDGVRVRFATS